MKHYITVKTSQPGRMAPNTALCFATTGAALLILSKVRRTRQGLMVVGLLGSITAALGVVSFFGYFSGVETAYGWGNLTRMAVHTAAGFIALGMGIFAFAWFEGMTDDSWIPDWIAFPAGIGMATVALTEWQALHAQLGAEHSSLPVFVLITGLLMTVFLVITIQLAQISWRRAKDVERVNWKLENEIIERKQAEEALRAAYNIINRSPAVAFLWKNAEGWPVEFVSENVVELFGHTAKEFTAGKVSYATTVHPDDLERVAQEVATYSEEEDRNDFSHDPYRIITKNGEVNWVDDMSSIRRDEKGDITHYEGILLDITDRVQAEEALQESEEKYRSMMEAMIESIYICSPDFRVEYMNPAMIKRTGRDATGGYCFRALHDLNKKCPWCLHDKSQHGEYNELEIVSPKDNRSYHISQTPVAHRDGSVSKLTIFRDITEMRETQAQLYRAQKMEAMGLLAGGVAHDLNNILSGIVSYPELLLMDLPEDSPLRKPIETIQESGMRASDVVEDLLTIARGVATGKETLNLNTIISEYLESPEYQELDKTYSFVNFETELDPDLLNMSGSPIHIRKTLMNLVINASEAIEGRGTVAISSMNRYLDEPLKGYDSIRTGEYAVLSVSDDGSGITPEDLEKIFEPFYTKKVMGRSGTGLGLAVVWNTVQDHNGYINVESNEKGTVFELYFPVTRKGVSDEKEKTPLENYLGHGEKILVVDDEERQREIACGILRKLGYNPEAVSSGEEAVEYVKEHAVDLIVLDMVMPKGINGRETYQQIIKIHPGQKAVIASGYAKTKEVDIAQELGAGKYIRKPYTLEKIGVAVKKEWEK